MLSSGDPSTPSFLFTRNGHDVEPVCWCRCDDRKIIYFLMPGSSTWRSHKSETITDEDDEEGGVGFGVFYAGISTLSSWYIFITEISPLAYLKAIPNLIKVSPIFSYRR